MDSVQAIEASFTQLAQVLEMVATKPIEFAKKVADVDIEMQLKLSQEQGKGEAIDILV